MEERPIPAMSGVSRIETVGPITRLHMSRAIAGRPVFWTSAYHWGNLLVDCGARTGREALMAFLADHPVTDALLTHGHEDHVGNAAPLEARGVRLHAPAPAVASLRAATRVPFYRAATWGNREPAHATPLAPHLTVDGKRFRVVHSPGHSDDHVLFYESETGWAFVGDAYMGKLRMVRRGENVPQQIASLRLLQALAPEKVFPAHGPILQRPATALSDVIEYLERLQERVHALHGRGMSVKAIRRELFGPQPFLHYVSGGEFSADHLVASLLNDSPSVPEGMPTPFASAPRSDAARGSL